LGSKEELPDLIDQHVAGGSEILEARNMTFAASNYPWAFGPIRSRRLFC